MQVRSSEIDIVSAGEAASRLAIDLLFLIVEVHKSTGNGESNLGASNSVIECALTEIPQTHEPKKARRWRRILKRARKGGTAPTLRFFATAL